MSKANIDGAAIMLFSLLSGVGVACFSPELISWSEFRNQTKAIHKKKLSAINEENDKRNYPYENIGNALKFTMGQVSISSGDFLMEWM